jgi:hypothetical protein
MKIPTVSTFSTVHATHEALENIEYVNLCRYIGMTYEQIAKTMNLSERTVRRYYWGIHSINNYPTETSREQIRIGACVPI